MTKTTFENIIFPTQKYRIREMGKPKPVRAFDTETYRGRAFLLCDSDGNAYEIKDTLDALEVLANNRFNRSINFFFNIDFDVRAILSYLPKEILTDLYVLNEVEVGEYYIYYIPRKFLKVRKGKRGVSYFDLYQFVNCSLEKACSKYLNLHKTDIGETHWESKEWIEENYEKIVYYCKNDARITAKLGEFVRDLFFKMGVDFNKPYSVASISAQYFSRYMPTVAFFLPQMQRYAYNAYRGGRFECFQRGYFSNAYKFDIHSAYPYAMSQLPDVANGRWRFYTDKVPENAELGFLRTDVVVREEKISLLPEKQKSLVVYPRMCRHNYFMTLQEYERAKEKENIYVKFKDGWFYFPATRDRPFRDIQRLYELKEQYKKDNNPLALTVKIILNSIYGKTIEVITAWEKKKTSEDKKEVSSVLAEIRDKYKRVYKAGKLFNPAYASFITSFTRNQVYDEMIKEKSHAIACFTDCIVTTKDYIKTSKALGGWELEKEGSAIILGSGVYQFLTENSKSFHMRGFRINSKKSLYDLLLENEDKDYIPLKQTFALSLGKYLFHSNFADGYYLNEFVNFEKQLNINFDQKRHWFSQFQTCSDVLNQSHLSITLQNPNK